MERGDDCEINSHVPWILTRDRFLPRARMIVVHHVL